MYCPPLTASTIRGNLNYRQAISIIMDKIALEYFHNCDNGIITFSHIDKVLTNFFNTPLNRGYALHLVKLLDDGVFTIQREKQNREGKIGNTYVVKITASSHLTWVKPMSYKTITCFDGKYKTIILVVPDFHYYLKEYTEKVNQDTTVEITGVSSDLGANLQAQIHTHTQKEKKEMTNQNNNDNNVDLNSVIVTYDDDDFLLINGLNGVEEYLDSSSFVRGYDCYLYYTDDAGNDSWVGNEDDFLKNEPKFDDFSLTHLELEKIQEKFKSQSIWEPSEIIVIKEKFLKGSDEGEGYFVPYKEKIQGYRDQYGNTSTSKSEPLSIESLIKSAIETKVSIERTNVQKRKWVKENEKAILLFLSEIGK